MAAAAAALSVPPIASAKPGYVVLPAERSSQLVVRGTQGFGIAIERFAGRVELTALKQDVAAVYVVRPGSGPADQIEASFPGLGRVSMRFHPSGEPQRFPSFCKGRASITQPGVFRGVFRFEGEQGFTRVVASHARGQLYRSFRQVCKRSEIGIDEDNDAHGYFLTATERSRRKEVLFSAARLTDSVFAGDTHHFAALWEKRPGMLVGRVAVAPAHPTTFAIEGPSARPVSAAVTPPFPFSGTASFNSSAGALAEWQGTLAVDFPGVGTVPLTGPSYKSKLCLNKRCVGNIPTAVPTASRSGLFAGRSRPGASVMMSEDAKFALGF